MSTNVNLTIDAPDADLTLKEPTDVTVATHALPNTQTIVFVGAYANQGNVTQKVGVDVIDNLVNCTLVGYKWTLPDATQVMTGTFDLAVDNQANLEVTIVTADEPLGTKGVDASFTVSVTHVQA